MLQRICSLLRIQPPVLLTRGLLWASGSTVPADETDGYQTGCIFQHTDGSSGTALYINEGSVTSCDFNAVDAGGITTSIDVGVFSSVTAGSGIALSSSDRSAVAIYGDDNGLSIASNVYNLRTRLLLTVDQDGASIRALMAQLKLADGVDVSTGIYTASQGYLELAGNTSAETGATLSCFDASLEVGAGNTLTVDSGGEVAGLHVETTGTGTITNNGTCAGILIQNASGAPDWPIGILVDGPSVSCGISIGKYASSYALGSAVRMSATTHTAAAAFFGETAAALGAGYMTRAVRGRHLINTDDDVNQETYGVQGQICAKGDATTTLKHLHAGVIGTFEVLSGVTLDTSGLGYDYAHAGVIARVGGLAAGITATDPLCGFLAFWNDQAGTGLSNSVGLAVYAPSAFGSKWGTGIIIDGRSVNEAIIVGSTTDAKGVLMTTTVTKAVGIYAELETDAGSAYNVRPLRSRLRVDVGGNVETETYGIQGQLNAYASTNLGHWHAGILGTLEGSAATVTVYNPLAGAAGIIGRVGGTITVDGTSFLAGIIALGNATVTLTDGKYIGLYITKAAGTNWSHGIYIDGTITNEAILVGSSATPLAYPLSATQNTCVSIYADLTDPGTDKFFRGLYVRTRYMPSDTEGGASVYGIRGHVLTVDTYDNVGVDENICGVHGYVTGIADALINDNGITVSGIKGELGGSGAGWDVKIACAIEAKVCLTALPGSTANAYCGVSVYAPTSDATPLDCAIYCWGYIQGGIDLRGCAGDSLDWVLGVSAGDAAVTATGATPIHGTAGVKIAIKVDGTTYYLLASTVPTG